MIESSYFMMNVRLRNPDIVAMVLYLIRVW